ncbi:MAG: hypothetical protein QXP66_00720 [Candidatus Aenigmatarchaeota archaeon]
MARIREYEFVTGIETSTLPDPGTPTAPSDIITKGYADSNYTPRSHVYGKVTNITQLKGIGPTARFNEQICYVAGLNLFYEWDGASTAISDDDEFVRPSDIPTDATPGRWVKVVFLGGGGSGGGSGIEQLLQKAEHERSGIFTEPLDNSLHATGAARYFTDDVRGVLLKDTVASSTVLELAWSPVFLNESDRDTNTTTNWSAQAAGTALTTNSTTKQVGSHSLQFDKNATDTRAGIRYDRGSDNFALGSNSRCFFYINLPSLVNLSSVYLRVYGSSTSDFRQWTRTTQADGSALAVGWNLILVDVSDTTGSTTGGAGWTITTLSRYVEVGVIATLASQTYTAILIDSIMFSLSKPEQLGFNGSELTLFNDSVRQNVTIDVGNLSYDGRLSLKTGDSTSVLYLGGDVSVSRGIIKRTVLQPNMAFEFDSSLTSGAIATTQEHRFDRIFRSSVSGKFKLVTDVVTSQFNEVRIVGGSTIEIDDPSDQSANYANGDTVHVFRTSWDARGVLHFRHLFDRQLTAASSHSSGLTTLTLSTSGINVGDFVCKNHLTSAVSLSALNANESFVTQPLDASPDGIQVVGDFLQLPYKQNAVLYWTLGDLSQDLAFGGRHMIGKYPTKSAFENYSTGTPIINSTGPRGKFGLEANGTFATAFFDASPSSDRFITFGARTVPLQGFFWFYPKTGATGNFLETTTYIAGPGEWQVGISGTSIIIAIFDGSSPVTTSLPFNLFRWNFVYFKIFLNFQKLFVNGATTSMTATLGSYVSGISHSFLCRLTGSPATTVLDFANNLIIRDLYLISGAPDLTEAEIRRIWNNGNYRPFEEYGIRYSHTTSTLSGQRLSVKNTLSRTTSAVRPVIVKSGIIKT